MSGDVWLANGDTLQITAAKGLESTLRFRLKPKDDWSEVRAANVRWFLTQSDMTMAERLEDLQKQIWAIKDGIREELQRPRPRKTVLKGLL
jgi:hypothetical protein